MNDLISRQAALNFTTTVTASEDAHKVLESFLDEFVAYVESLPSAQPKTAGRCINCKYHYDGDCPMRFEEIVEIDDDGYIDHDVIYHDFTRDDGYCDRWERRTDE